MSNINSDEIFKRSSNLLNILKFKSENMKLISLRNDIENIRCILKTHTFMYRIYEDTNTVLSSLYESKFRNEKISQKIYNYFHDIIRINIKEILVFKKDSSLEDDYRVFYFLDILNKLLIYIGNEAVNSYYNKQNN